MSENNLFIKKLIDCMFLAAVREYSFAHRVVGFKDPSKDWTPFYAIRDKIKDFVGLQYCEEDAIKNEDSDVLMNLFRYFNATSYFESGLNIFLEKFPGEVDFRTEYMNIFMSFYSTPYNTSYDKFLSDRCNVLIANSTNKISIKRCLFRLKSITKTKDELEIEKVSLL